MSRYAPLLVLLMVVGPMASAQAECRYFLSTYQVSSCRQAPTEKPSDAAVNASSEPVLPGLEDTPAGPSDELICTCDYVLKGSDPLCDLDRSQDVTQLFPRDDADPVCRRAKSVCATVCPRTVP